ncbi:DUF4200 domain-containing protein [Trichonephila inaurata madagascariensis]|uniref:DUF4200 domain-containing protein n=1 Tax=Trichonephila inaurata madagascariensis TaxID=2747483 RepID=A0A8X6MKH0_9ARAC|nr:DUF4200 domain-containing protein [Trichonephila inaurata madagascariensis]
MSQSRKKSLIAQAKTSQEETNARMDSCMVTIKSLRDLAQKEASLVQNALKDMEENLIDPGYTLELTKSIYRSENRSIDEYIKRNTDILLNEHATVVRQNIIQKMKDQIREMNEEISHDAEKLGEDISNFFDFIQSNYTAASNSFKKVTEIAKKNYEKVEQIAQTEDKLFALKNELQELERQLLDCLMCSAFLKKLNLETPVDISTVSAVEVMKIIGRLKESNLSLVHNNSLNKGSSQLEATQLVMARNQMDEELAAWDEKIADAGNELEEIREVHEKLKNQIRNLEQEDIERHKEFRELELKKLTEIYKLCTGSDVQVDDPLLMKVAIDHTVQGILIEMNTFPRKKIKELLKILEAEKKLSERKIEEALRAQRASERLKKALKPAMKKVFKFK